MVTAMTTAGDQRLHVVLGGRGGTGGAIVRELVARGLPVRSVTRTPDPTGASSVENVGADLTDPEQTRRAIEGAAVVYHAANPPYQHWVEQFPLLNRSIVAATGAVGARLVFTDNLYMYGPDAGVMTEDSPQRASDRKGHLRASLAGELLEAQRAGDCEVTIGRSSDYFGPGGLGSALGDRLFDAAVAGKPIRWLGDIDAPHSVAYLPDIARGLVTLGLADEATGQVWHLPSSGSPTGREFVAVVADALGHKLKLSPTPRWMVRLVGLFSVQVREVSGVMYQWEAPFVSSDAGFQAMFGPQPATPLRRAIEETVAWFAARHGRQTGTAPTSA
jgi:nucleoside-diphosphate-sugar epimerase